MGRLRGLMELSWAVFEPSWPFLRLSMRVLERSRAVLGGLQPILAVSGALQRPSDLPRTPRGGPHGDFLHRPGPPPGPAPIHIYVYIYVYMYIGVGSGGGTERCLKSP